jgi:prevent-host-death family protein
MVMTRIARDPSAFPRRLGVAEAKSRLSDLLRRAASGPAIIHNRGRDLAVVLAVEDYDRLIAPAGATRRGGAAFLERVEMLKERHGGGSSFTPSHLEIKPVDPFTRRSRRRR